MARPFFELEPRAERLNDISRIHPSRRATGRSQRGLSRGGGAQAAAACVGGGGFSCRACRRGVRRGSESAHPVHLFRQLRQLFRPHSDAGRRHQGVEQPGRMVLGLAQMALDVGRDHSDQLCRHHDRGGACLCTELLRRPKHLAGAVASFRHSPPARIRPHRSRHRVRADLRHRLRSRPDGGRAGDCDPFHRARLESCFPRSSKMPT